MADIGIEQSPGREIINLTGEFEIASARELRNAILAAQGRADIVVVNLREATDVDLSLLQILCSAHRSAIGENKQFTVTGCEHEAFQKVVERSGFLRHIGCDEDTHKTCMWICD